MARLLRVDRPSLWYHLTARGNEQRLTFRDDRDREHFLELQRGGEAFPPMPGNRSAAAGAGRRGRILFVECSQLTPILIYGDLQDR